MKPYEPLDRRHRWSLALVAAVVALAVVSAALAPFAVDGTTPYFDAAALATVDRCRDMPLRAERHACLRAAAAASDAVVVARR